MKDLLVFTADADALAFISSILMRPEALGVRSLKFDIERHSQRDSGMVQSGAELLRMKKGGYKKAVMVLDHHGCGREHKLTPPQLASELQFKLDSFSWSGHSAVTVLAPELELWVWFCEPAIAKHLGIGVRQLRLWVDERARTLNRQPEELRRDEPKELFEHIVRGRCRTTISPRDFAEIGSFASVASLDKCPSFSALATTLRQWFPV
jgi:hypothetical protein